MQTIATDDGAVHALAEAYGDGGMGRCTRDLAGPIAEAEVANVTCRLCQDDLRRAGWRQRWPTATRIG